MEPRALEILRVATRLGLTSFGGPVAHLGYFREEYVVRRRWLDEATYADLVALCQFLPGPASSQVGIAIGIARGGLLGGVAAWPAERRIALEFRHESWFDDEVYALLRARNAALCVAETEEGSTPAVATADFGYLRLRAVEYTDDQLRGWLDTMARIGAGWREAYVFFKHEDTGTGPALARRFLALHAR